MAIAICNGQLMSNLSYLHFEVTASSLHQKDSL